MGPIIPDNCVKISDPCLNRSREIPPEAARGSIFDRFLNFDKCQQEGASDIISSLVADPTSMKVPVKVRDSRSNRSRDI